MLEAIWSWFGEHYPLILIFLGSIIIVGGSVWVVASFYFQRFKSVESKVNGLQCGPRMEEIQILKRSTCKLDSLCEQINEISKWIMKLDSAEIDRLAPKFSPRKMTKAGLDLYAASGARAVVSDNEDYFIEQIRSTNPQTPLDVEDNAYSVLIGKLPEPIFNGVKNYIYYQPEKIVLKDDNGSDITIALSLPLLVRLMSIDLRDRYLQKYPIL